VKCRCRRDFSPRSDGKRSTIIIMRAILRDQAPNTYYGQWPGEKALFSGPESLAIVHDELAASARFVTFDVPARRFPRESLADALEICRSTKEKSAREAKWRASSDDQALTASI